MKKLQPYLMFAILIIVGIAGLNYAMLSKPVHTALQHDERNEGIGIRVHYKHYVSMGTLVFDIHSLSGDRSRADVLRALLVSAQALKDKTFNRVELACKGTTRFYMEGSYFRTLGEEYEDQNPLYTMRTLPQNLYNPEGSPAFSTWEGGILGVAKEQLEDHNEFHDKWYGELND